MSRVRLHDPGSTEAYTLDWNDAAEDSLADGETISASEWAVESAGSDGELDIDSDTNDTTTTTVVLTGGTKGHTYRVVNTITTSEGRTVIGSLTIRVGPR